MKVRTLIVDDEAPARARIRQLLQAESDFQIVGECVNGRQAVIAVQKEQPALMFLDVQMPRMSGFDVCAALEGGPRPLVIFVTAYDQHALRAFEVHAIDYLLKPFDRERFQRALAHVRERLSHRRDTRMNERLTELIEGLKSGNGRGERLALKVGSRVILLRRGEIRWVEADGNYVRVKTDKAVHQVRETLSRLEEQLPEEQFMRVSRSVLVNMDHVKELQPMFYGDYAVLMSDGSRLTLSRTFRDRVEKLFGGGG